VRLSLDQQHENGAHGCPSGTRHEIPPITLPVGEAPLRKLDSSRERKRDEERPSPPRRMVDMEEQGKSQKYREMDQLVGVVRLR
jgi:hypothetical protein